MTNIRQISFATNSRSKEKKPKRTCSIGFPSLISQIRRKQGLTTLSKTQLDKLAQLVSFTSKDVTKEVANFATRKTLFKSASQKFITNSIVAPLLYLENKSILHNQYQNAFYCGSEVEIIDGKVQRNRCKTRSCTSCNADRTGILINQYQETIDSWKGKHFVTLTVPNMRKELLSASISAMTGIMGTILRWYKKDYGETIKGIRKLEVTYNRFAKTYHPHFHIIVENETQAIFIKRNWMKIINEKNYSNSIYHSYILGSVTMEAQDVRKCDNNSTLELFKYFTKFWETNEKKDSVKTYTPEVIDVILTSLIRRRIIQSMGFKIKDIIEVKDNYEDQLKDYYNELSNDIVDKLASHHQTLAKEKKYDPVIDGMYKYNNVIADWQEINTGAVLTYYKKPESRKDWFSQNIGIESIESVDIRGFEDNKNQILQMFDLEKEENKHLKFLERAKENSYIKQFNTRCKSERGNILNQNFGENASIRIRQRPELERVRANNEKPCRV